MKKSCFIGILLSLVLLTSCGSSNSTSGGATAYNKADVAGTAETASLPEYSVGEAGDSNMKADASQQQSTQVTQIANKKIIKNANLDIESKDVSECYRQLLDYIISQGGYEFSQSLSNSSDYASLNAVIKAPPDKLDAILEHAKDYGKIINVSTSTDDITSQYTDTEIRLENKRKNLEKYYDYYSKATTIEEIVAIQTQIDNITADIESYEGQIKLWDSQVNESTITIYIQEASDPNKISEDIDWNSISLSTMGKIMSNGFKAVINGIISFFQWMLIIVVSISPILIIAAIVLLVIFKFRKNKKAKTKTEIKIL